MPQTSAGILMYRNTPRGTEVLLVHPGGPFWARKDAGAWSTPKGLYAPGEDPEAAARREFEEETGCLPAGGLLPLGAFRTTSGKVVEAFAAEGDFDLNAFRSNVFQTEWPPKSGRAAEFPEADRAGWFGPEEAEEKLLKGQRPILAALLKRLAAGA
jgi:predicted NUDIX family NTP pyrophosphohydrolase